MRAVRNHAIAFVVVLLAVLHLPAAAAALEPMRCDVDGDRRVTQDDLRAIIAAVGTPAAVARSDPRDADRDGRITSADVMLCMAACMVRSCQAPNTAPTANAGPDQTASLGSTVFLSGARSTDPDGQALTYAWKFKERPQGSHAQLAGASTVTPSFVMDKPGRFVVTLEVSDGVAADSDIVVVSYQNSAPVAQAGPDQSVFVGDVVRIDGTGSTDVDGDRLTFAWTFVSKPPGSNAVLQSLLLATGPQVRFTVDVEGTFVVQLVVSDGQQQSAPDLVVVATSNTRPVANPKASCAPLPNTDCSAPIGSVVTLDGSASTDVDGDALTYAWTLLSRPPGSAATLTTPAAIMATFVADVPGSFVAQLVVSDGTSSSLPRTLDIASANARPVAIAAINPASIATLPQLVQLDGTGSLDADGQALTYGWSLLARPPGSVAVLSSATAAQPTFVADVVGTYTAQLIVNDGFLASLPVTVSASTANQPPVANAGPDQSVVAGTVVQLTSAGSSDPEGLPLGYFWSLLSKPAGSTADFNNANAANPTFPADRKGTFVAQLIVNDGTLNSAPDTMQVTATNRAPLAVADSYSVAQDGSLVIGAAAGVLANDTDADGDTLTAILVGAAPSGFALSANGGFTYTPPAGFSGTATAQYKANDGTADSSTVDVTFTVTAGLPTVTIAATDPNASEVGLEPGVFTVTRTGSTALQLFVNYTIGGTASNNFDYVNLGGVVVIPAGQASATIMITPITDTVVESPETVVLTLAPNAAYVVGSPSGATVTIADEAQVVTIVATDPDASELGLEPGVFTVTRTGSTALQLFVNYTIGGTASNNFDYVNLGGVVVIPAGQASATITITPITDTVVESPETVVLTLAANAAYIVGSPGSATVTIADEAQVVTIVATDPDASEVGLEPGVFTVTRTGSTALQLFVNYTIGGTASNNFDYVNLGGVVVIPAGQASATITITPIADTVVESPETVVLTLAANAAYIVGSPGSATVTIADGVPNTVTVAATDANASETGPDSGVFTFTRSGPTTFDLVVSFTIGGTAANFFDYQTISAAVTIPAGQTSATVTITPVADALIEGNETVILTVAPNPTTYLVGAPAAATVTIADGVPNTVTVAATDANASETGPDSGVFTFTRSGPTTFDLVVSFTIGGTAANFFDYQTISAAVTIPAGQTSATVTITPVADALIEGNETVVLTIAPNPTIYLVGAPAAATVTIADGVPNTVTVAATDANASETGPDSGVFTFTRSGPTTFDLVVSFTIGGTAANFFDYQTISAAVTIPAGQTSATVTITPNADGESDAGETVILTIAQSPTTYVVGSPSSATVTID